MSHDARIASAWRRNSAPLPEHARDEWLVTKRVSAIAAMGAVGTFASEAGGAPIPVAA